MTPKRIEQGLDLLTRIAEENPGGNSRHTGWSAKLAAGIWVKNELIAVGWNQAKSHPLQNKFPKQAGYVHLHAEIHAITCALKRFSEDELRAAKTTLMVVRTKRKDHRRNSSWVRGIAKPCNGCAAAIAHYRIKNVVWSEDFHDHNHMPWTCVKCELTN